MSDYLWDRRDPPDPFVEALERRLAPLGDEALALVDGLDLDGGLEEEGQHEAVILSLPLAPARDRERERGHWWILAAALILLAVSVVVLAREQRRRIDEPASIVADRGDVVVSGRVQIAVLAVAGPEPITAHAVLVELRDTHQALARCALELEPGERLETKVTLVLDGGVSRIAFDRELRDDRELATCIRAALLTWDASALGRVDVELALHLQHNQLEEQD